LKAELKQAVSTVFTEDPRWLPAITAKALELAAAVFAGMYHRIPQEGIDGKSPAERAEAFDPVRAAARQADLFRRALNGEPSDEYARHLHVLFQLPGEVKETVATLRMFPTRILRQLVDRVKDVMGPPCAESIYDPIGFLAARARELNVAAWKKANAEAWREAEAERESQEQDRQRQDESQRPEAHVDGMLRTLVQTVRSPHALSVTVTYMRELLHRLAASMGGFFATEIERLKARATELARSAVIAERVTTILDELAAEVRPP
jgi:hypothetical protein